MKLIDMEITIDPRLNRDLDEMARRTGIFKHRIIEAGILAMLQRSGDEQLQAMQDLHAYRTVEPAAVVKC